MPLVLPDDREDPLDIEIRNLLVDPNWRPPLMYGPVSSSGRVRAQASSAFSPAPSRYARFQYGLTQRRGAVVAARRAAPPRRLGGHRLGGTGAQKRRHPGRRRRLFRRRGKKPAKRNKWRDLKRKLELAQPLRMVYNGNIQGAVAVSAAVNAQKAFTVDVMNTFTDLQFNWLTVGLPNVGVPSTVYDAFQMSYKSRTRILNSNTVPINITLYYCKPRKYGWTQTPANLGDPINQWTTGLADEKGGTMTTDTLGCTPFMVREFCRRTHIYKSKRIEIAPGETAVATLSDSRCHRIHHDEIFGTQFNGKNEWGTKFILGVLEGSVIGYDNAGDANRSFLAPVKCKLLTDKQVEFKQVEVGQPAKVYNATNLVAPIGVAVIINEDVDKQDVLYSIP